MPIAELGDRPGVFTSARSRASTRSRTAGENGSGASATRMAYSPEPKTFAFPVTASAGDTVFDLGVTGADWPGGKKVNPVAWKLTLLAADGRALAEHKSFLWEKPAK